MTITSPACPQASQEARRATEVTDQPVCATVLGLDCSSTTIGWCVHDGQVRDAGTLRLTGSDIAERCRQARAGVYLILLNHPDVDAVLALLAEKQIAWCEVTPSEAKHAATGRGNASKADMMTAAGLDDEHAADAVGVAKAALKHVQVLR